MLLLLGIIWNARTVDSLIRLYPEIEPYLLVVKATLPSTPHGQVKAIVRRLCRDRESRACRMVCDRLASKGSPVVSIPPCPKTYTVLKHLYRRTHRLSYLVDIGRLYPRSKEAKKLLKMKVSRKLKLKILLAHRRYGEVMRMADTTDPEEYPMYLMAKFYREGLTFSEVLKLPPKYRKRPLIKHLVRFLKEEDYDSIEIALLELIKLGDYERAYRITASEVAKPFLRYEASDLYVRMAATAHEGLSAGSFIWLGLAAYGVHRVEDAHNYFYEARERARVGSFEWTQATYWLYRLTMDSAYVRDLRLHNPISYYYLDLNLPVPWREEDVWDTTGDLRNYRIGRILEEIGGWGLAFPWYAKDVPSGYRRARELLGDGNFLRASYLLSRVYRVAPKERGVPLWWGKMAFPYDTYREEIDSAAKEFGVDALFLTAIVREESRFKSRARSRVGAIGLAQIMPFNVRNFSRAMKERVRNPYDPLTNLRMGAFFLKRDFGLYGSPHLVAAAYNAGREALNRWLCDYGYEMLEFHHFIDIIPYNETRNYVRRVMRSYAVYRSLYGKFGGSLRR